MVHHQHQMKKEKNKKKMMKTTTMLLLLPAAAADAADDDDDDAADEEEDNVLFRFQTNFRRIFEPSPWMAYWLLVRTGLLAHFAQHLEVPVLH